MLFQLQIEICNNHVNVSTFGNDGIIDDSRPHNKQTKLSGIHLFNFLTFKSIVNIVWLNIILQGLIEQKLYMTTREAQGKQFFINRVLICVYYCGD